MSYFRSSFRFSWVLIIAATLAYFPGSEVIYASKYIADSSFLAKKPERGTIYLMKSEKPQDFKIPDGPDAVLYSVVEPAEAKRITREEKKLVVIDPGHGGQDPGAVSNGLKEKAIVLDISLRLDELLRKSGVNTLMTRDDDTPVELKERIYRANRENAALFISIHCNWYTDPAFKGVTTLYYPSASLSCGKLFELDYARLLQNKLVEDLKMKDMGINDRPNLAVLRHAQMPSILTEIGFMSNKEDAALLADREFRQRVAEVLAEGLLEALAKIDGERKAG